MTRAKLPNRRPAISFAVEHRGHSYVVSIGNDGSSNAPLEVFISFDQSGSELEATARDAAIVVSLALQHGCPVETIRDALTKDHDGSPASIVGAVLEAMP